MAIHRIWRRNRCVQREEVYNAVFDGFAGYAADGVRICRKLGHIMLRFIFNRRRRHVICFKINNSKLAVLLEETIRDALEKYVVVPAARIELFCRVKQRKFELPSYFFGFHDALPYIGGEEP